MADFDIAHLSLKQENYSQATEFFEIKLIRTKVFLTSLIYGLSVKSVRQDRAARPYFYYTKTKVTLLTLRQSKPIKTRSKCMYMVVRAKGGKTCVGVS